MLQKIGVKFKINPKIYSFAYEKNDLEKGDFVIVETSLGLAFGKVETIEELSKEENEYKKVIRKATKKDIAQHEENLEKERNAIKTIKELISKYNLEMDVVNAEYSFDSSKVIIDFISENRVDFRDLVKELATLLKTRIELRQIGIRDQAKMVGGIGICGRVCCCASHLKDFEKVSIKMAKVQGLSLNPTKISGSCGRLMCCLEYENDYYSEIYPLLPKLNAEVKTPEGNGSVIYLNALKQVVSVKIEQKDGSSVIKDFKLQEIKSVPKNTENNSAKNKENSEKNKIEKENQEINKDNSKKSKK